MSWHAFFRVFFHFTWHKAFLIFDLFPGKYLSLVNTRRESLVGHGTNRIYWRWVARIRRWLSVTKMEIPYVRLLLFSYSDYPATLFFLHLFFLYHYAMLFLYFVIKIPPSLVGTICIVNYSHNHVLFPKKFCCICGDWVNETFKQIHQCLCKLQSTKTLIRCMSGPQNYLAVVQLWNVIF